ncbi:uncharacterized protein L969DRAFT_227661 [Mixia osmundae IAM 14324]|uniref:Uncharacterized protein n=1 Tax=Mixia osmundae (strain CBS 9802 / IAM 14324 / JCM 22182 / KY 12970) TaxID=764103 RepID=G7E256_MIXOS|nr:uncharacterized protein L969DRAFT_227661 [Mixia osmundae IAM 14324]KEI36788.1 hypothetical protein L969DRAFT_227661 [Mixia osmundae IAM 14324]GAA96916.1 hypothetical protein E5Q_03590 [Mixia osmundae IAM 14324]
MPRRDINLTKFLLRSILRDLRQTRPLPVLHDGQDYIGTECVRTTSRKIRYLCDHLSALWVLISSDLSKQSINLASSFCRLLTGTSISPGR